MVFHATRRPKLPLFGLMSITEMLLQPALDTTAIGEKPWPGNWSAMAMEFGCASTPLPPESLQTGFVAFLLMSTALMTKKSVALDVPALFETVTAYRFGSERKEAGIVTVRA